MIYPYKIRYTNDFCISWTGDKPHLHDIEMDCAGDKIVVIVGPVGSSKTTLLHAILGELPIQHGSCRIHGRISYAGRKKVYPIQPTK